MKVLLIDVNCNGSSTGKLVYQIYQYLNNKGNTCAVCYGRGKSIRETNIYKFGLDWETSLHALLTRITGYTGCFSFFSTKKLINYIERFKPDIVHIHEMHAYFLNISQLLNYLSEKGIPTVFTLHCEFNYTGKCGHSLECEKWKTRCGHCPHLNNYPKTFLFDHTRKMHMQKEKLFHLMSTSVITTVSPWLTERAQQSFFKDWKIRTVYNGIDTSIFTPRSTRQLKEKLMIGTRKVIIAVASHIMNPEKGGTYLESLARRMTNYAFVLVGTDEKNIRFNDNILYIPKITNQIKLSEFYSLGDVFVLCSLKETFSLTCIEALCCGTPVAGFRCGAPEMIFEEPYALFVEYGDIDALEKVIIRQLLNKNCSISTYGKKFSLDNMLTKYKTIYEEILKV